MYSWGVPPLPRCFEKWCIAAKQSYPLNRTLSVYDRGRPTAFIFSSFRQGRQGFAGASCGRHAKPPAPKKCRKYEKDTGVRPHTYPAFIRDTRLKMVAYQFIQKVFYSEIPTFAQNNVAPSLYEKFMLCHRDIF